MLPVHVSATVLDLLHFVHCYDPQLQREEHTLHMIINQYNIYEHIEPEFIFSAKRRKELTWNPTLCTYILYITNIYLQYSYI